MKIRYLIPLLFLTSSAIAQNYALPEVIGRIHNGGVYGYDYCSIGDQNGDGCDDLMARHWSQVVDVYYGGENMGDELDFRFDPREIFGDEFRVSVEPIWNIGNLIIDREPFIGITAVVSEPVRFYTLLYEIGDSLSQIPQIILSSRYIYKFARSSTQFDINGDGFHDLITKVTEDGDLQKLQVYFGGANFDTLPDWETRFHSRSNRAWVTGGDINADGYDDFIFRNDGYSLFLGGDPPDTNSHYHIEPDQFEGEVSMRRIDYNGYSMLPDVNDDGYDDWGLYFTESDGMAMNDGYMIFFGGEEPDMIPDLELEGHRRMWPDEGELCGGDFNGDGIGDIATAMTEVTGPRNGEVHIHFGSRWIDGKADIYIDSSREYDGEFFPLGRAIGGVGDYNGDGTDDFVVRARRENPELVVFAGNPDWQVGVPDEALPQDYNVSMNASPNPFNNSVNVSFEIPQAGHVELLIYDIRGREIEILVNRRMGKGLHLITWGNDRAGVYVLSLSDGEFREIRKVVCLR